MEKPLSGESNQGEGAALAPPLCFKDTLARCDGGLRPYSNTFFFAHKLKNGLTKKKKMKLYGTLHQKKK